MTAKALFQQVKDHVLTRIQSGQLKVDDRVPSEAELVTALGVSRMTANRALKELTEAGHLVRIAGGGTFVADRRTRGELLSIRDIADEIEERGKRHTAKVLAHQKIRASEALANQFMIAPGSPLFQARVLHLQDDEPITLEERWVNPLSAPDFLEVDLTRETSYSYLTRAAPLQEAEHSIRAVMTSPEITYILKLKTHEPALLLHRRTFSGGRVATVADLWSAGSRYEISGRFQP